MPPENPVDAWLSSQSPATQQAVAKLRRSLQSAPHIRFGEQLRKAAAYHKPQAAAPASSATVDDFLTSLAEIAPQVRPRMLPALHSFWTCVPSKLAFQVAVTRCDSSKDLKAFQKLAEKALLDAADVADFDAECFADDPMATTINWLNGRVIRHKHASP